MEKKASRDSNYFGTSQNAGEEWTQRSARGGEDVCNPRFVGILVPFALADYDKLLIEDRLSSSSAHRVSLCPAAGGLSGVSRGPRKRGSLRRHKEHNEKEGKSRF